MGEEKDGAKYQQYNVYILCWAPNIQYRQKLIVVHIKYSGSVYFGRENFGRGQKRSFCFQDRTIFRSNYENNAQRSLKNASFDGGKNKKEDGKPGIT